MFTEQNFDPTAAFDTLFPRSSQPPKAFFNTSCQGVRVDMKASRERMLGATVDLTIEQQNVCSADAEQLANFFKMLAARLREEGEA